MNSIVNLIQPLLQVSAPKVPSCYTAWADAVVMVGRSTHGHEWNDAEKAKSQFDHTDRQALAMARLANENPELLRRHSNRKTWESRWRSRSPHRSEEQRATDDKIGEDLRVEVAQALAPIYDEMPSLDELVKENAARKSMLAGAKAKIVDAIMDSQIKAFWMPRGSPNLPTELPIGAFTGALASQEHQLLVMGIVTRNNKSGHIYLDTDGLARMAPLAADPRDDAAALGLKHLSPYMRLMIHVARHNDISADNQTKASALEASIDQFAPLFGLTTGKGGDIIDRNRITMAMFLRDK